jgi:hypothetical protein
VEELLVKALLLRAKEELLDGKVKRSPGDR